MTQEGKQLLLEDLSARLSYGVMCQVDDGAAGLNDGKLIEIDISEELVRFDADYYWDAWIDDVKPYLRPMSSMTEEEKEELLSRLPKYWNLEIDKLEDLYFDIRDASYPDIELLTDIIDWLNKNMFDYRGLIEKGLALEAPEGMYDRI